MNEISSTSESSADKKVFKVFFSRSNCSIDFDASRHETLLDAALEAGMAVAYDCCAGVDGLCRVRCQGNVHYLSEPCASIENDEVLVCIAVPTSDVKLDF